MFLQERKIICSSVSCTGHWNTSDLCFCHFYAERVLGALGLNLELKARVYEAPTLSSLFLLNNYNYIVKTLQRYEYCMNYKTLLIRTQGGYKHELSELLAASSDWRTCPVTIFLGIGRGGKVQLQKLFFSFFRFWFVNFYVNIRTQQN